MNTQNNVITSFLRDGNRNPIGAISAVKQGETIKYGASFVHPKDMKKRFDRSLLAKISAGRALSGREPKAPANRNAKVKPEDFAAAMENMKARAKKYFKV